MPGRRAKVSAVVGVLIVAGACFALRSSAQVNPPIPPGLLGGGVPTSLNPQPLTKPGGTGPALTPNGTVYVPPPGAAEWTVLVYTVADNDLEGPLLDDLDEMECIGSTKQVNIVMEIDRWRPKAGSPEADRDDQTNGDWDNARRYHITKDDCSSNIGSKLLEDMPEIDMSHPKELAKFIAWGVQRYPAKHYALIMGDHGDGWKGGYVDENAPPEPGTMLMALSELSDALVEGRKQANIPKFEVLATDACLMGSIEVADALAAHANFWAASEELVPGPGYDYKPIFTKLTQNPSIDGQTWGKTFVDSIRTFYGSSSAESDPSVTAALFDMSKIAGAKAAVDKLATLLKSDLEGNKISLGMAGQVVDQFGPQTDPMGAQDGFADLVQVAAVVRDTTNNAELKAAATAVITAVDASRVDKFNGEDRTNARGLSIWLPPTEDIVDYLGSYKKTPFGKSSPWSALLASYAHAFDKSLAPTISDLKVIKNPVNPWQWERDVTARIDGEVRSAVMIVSENFLSSMVPVEINQVTDPALFKKLPEGPGVTAWKKGTNTVSAHWNPQYATLSGKGGIEFPLVVNRERLGGTTFDSNVTIRSLASNAEEVVMLRFATSGSGFAGAKLLTGFFIDHAEGEVLYTPFDPKKLPAGKVAFEPRYTVIDSSGKSNVLKLPLSVKWDKIDDLKINVRPMLPGIYTLTFLAEDFAGHVAVSKITSTLP